LSEIVIADSSPLIAFGRINKFSLLSQLFGIIIIPQAVADECFVDPTRLGATAIQQAIDKKLIKIHPNPPVSQTNDLPSMLGMGEIAAIQLAHSLKLPLIIDEKLGRTTATKLNIPIIGTGGILVLAKQRKLINAVQPLILRLQEEGYYLSNKLIEIILKRAGEI